MITSRQAGEAAIARAQQAIDAARDRVVRHWLAVELLPNGLMRVYDQGAKWSACYTRDGCCVSGMNRPEYRDAARKGSSNVATCV